MIFSINVLWFLIATLGSLVAGTIARLATIHQVDPETREKRLSSLKTWWVLAALILGAVAAGRFGIFLLLGVTSLLALYEYTKMAAPRREDRWSIRLLYVATAAYYAAAYATTAVVSTMHIPLAFLALAWGIAIIQVLQGETTNFIQRTAGLVWGVVIVVFGLSMRHCS